MAQKINGSQISGTWQSYSPTWTNVTVGNGTQTARYTRVGDTVTVYISIVAGTTTAFSNTIVFTLPVTAASYRASVPHSVMGQATAIDTGVAGYIGVVETDNSATSGTLRWDAGSAFSANFPFAEGTGDAMSLSFSYEAA